MDESNLYIVSWTELIVREPGFSYWVCYVEQQIEKFAFSREQANQIVMDARAMRDIAAVQRFGEVSHVAKWIMSYEDNMRIDVVALDGE